MSSCCTAPDIGPPAKPSWPGLSRRAVLRPSWSGLPAIARRMAAWLRSDAADRPMVHLDERMLRDVGLSEADLPRAVRRERLERDSAAWRLLGSIHR
jgi:uncharacterized protein YjiS (DUF1127 family)